MNYNKYFPYSTLSTLFFVFKVFIFLFFCGFRFNPMKLKVDASAKHAYGIFRSHRSKKPNDIATIHDTDSKTSHANGIETFSEK